MNIVNQMVILMVEHENDSQTRILVGSEDKARSLYHKLVHLGYSVAVRPCPGASVPTRTTEELARGTALMDEAKFEPIPYRVLP
jgi:hypothetical protein